LPPIRAPAAAPIAVPTTADPTAAVFACSAFPLIDCDA